MNAIRSVYVDSRFCRLRTTGNYISHGRFSVDLRLKRLFFMRSIRLQICIGVGRPFESSGAMEAVARGSVFINPKFITKRRKPVQDLSDYNAKPTSRRVSDGPMAKKILLATSTQNNL